MKLLLNAVSKQRFLVEQRVVIASAVVLVPLRKVVSLRAVSVRADLGDHALTRQQWRLLLGMLLGAAKVRIRIVPRLSWRPLLLSTKHYRRRCEIFLARLADLVQVEQLHRRLDPLSLVPLRMLQIKVLLRLT